MHAFSTNQLQIFLHFSDRQKTECFLTFSGGIEIEHRAKCVK